MKTQKELIDALRDWNLETFKEMGLQPFLREHLEDGREMASVEVPAQDIRRQSGCYECFCGETSGGYNSGTILRDQCLALRAPGGSPTLVAAGAVIDRNSPTAAALPVVLAVGINYGQSGHYLNHGIPLLDDSQMRPRLMRTFAKLAASGCNTPLGESDCYHLVAANFFPWITSLSWSGFGFNSIEEAMLINCWGYGSGIEPIKNLIARLNPELVVFHGANNAVPLLGTAVAADLAKTSGGKTAVIFCDNLAPSPRPAISNAITLCDCVGRSILINSDFDD